MLELNLMKKAWKAYGVHVEITAPGLKKVLKWGTKCDMTIKKIRRKLWNKTKDLKERLWYQVHGLRVEKNTHMYLDTVM